MSHALMETWNRREGRTLTVAGYAASGGIRGAVARSAETVYVGVEEDQRHVLRDLVLRLVTAGAEGEPVRSRVPRRLLSSSREHEDLIDLLVSSRLVTSDAGVVEIAHEALARAWPRLQGWLEEDVEGQRILHHLSSAADSWDLLGRADSELYRGARLSRALEWRSRGAPTLTETEAAFLDAAEQAEQSERRDAEVRARAQARLIRRQRGLLAGAVVLLVAALVAGRPRRPSGRPGRHQRGCGAGRRDVRRGPPRRRPGPGDRRHRPGDAARGGRRPHGRLADDPREPAGGAAATSPADPLRGLRRRPGHGSGRQPRRGDAGRLRPSRWAAAVRHRDVGGAGRPGAPRRPHPPPVDLASGLQS